MGEQHMALRDGLMDTGGGVDMKGEQGRKGEGAWARPQGPWPPGPWPPGPCPTEPTGGVTDRRSPPGVDDRPRCGAVGGGPDILADQTIPSLQQRKGVRNPTE